MKLSVREAAAFLNQPETQLYRWIKDGSLPAHKMNDRYCFDRAELLEWAAAQGISVDPDALQGPESRPQEPALIADALDRGGIHYHVPGKTKEDVLRSIVERLPVHEGEERDSLYDMLVAREAMGSTGVGEGIALPHVRSQVMLDEIEEPVISLCFLDEPVEFDAIDQRPVDIVFTLMTPTVRGHLHALSRLAYLLRDKRFNATIRSQAAPGQILDLARELEARRVTERPKPSHV